MALSQEAAEKTITLLIRRKMEETLGPVFKSVGELTSQLPGDPDQNRKELLDMIQEQTSTLINEQKERAGRRKFVVHGDSK